VDIYIHWGRGCYNIVLWWSFGRKAGWPYIIPSRISFLKSMTYPNFMP
jgi:hypothetical protein